MNGTFRERLERAFETLKKQDITPILRMTGSTNVGDWDNDHFRDIAQAAGTPDAFVAASVGSEEERGGYWDDCGRLRYRCDDGLLTRLLFRYSTTDCARRLVKALQDEGLEARWDGSPFSSVQLFLGAAYLDVAAPLSTGGRR